MDQAGIIRDLLSWLEKIWITPCHWTTWRQNRATPNGIYSGCSKTLPIHPRRFIQTRKLSKTAVYTTALEPHYLPEKMPAGQRPSLGLFDFIQMVYGSCLPMLKLRRRKRHDIERFYPEGDRQPPKH